MTYHGIGGQIAGRHRIHGHREFDFESIRHGPDGFHLKRDFSVPDKTLQAFVHVSGRSPAPVGFTGEQGSVGSPGQTEHARTESAPESEGSALVFTVYFFKKYAGDHAHALVSNQYLAFERTEMPFGDFDRFGVGNAQDAVRQPYSGQAHGGEKLLYTVG